MSARGIRAGVRRLLRPSPRTRPQVDDEVDEELRSYLAARIDSLVARGMTYHEAEAEALRRLGGTLEETRQRLHQSAEHREARMHIQERVDDFVSDLRYATRGLAHRPAFTAVAVLTLAVGIGATTAIFSAVDAMILRPLPYLRPSELMKVSLVTPDRNVRKGTDDMVWSYPKFVVFRDAQRVFRDMALYALQQFNITSGEVEAVRGEFVGATYLRTIGVVPGVGHDFDLAMDAHPGAARQVIISDALWQRRFNADPGVVGTTIDVDRAPYDVIGVAPAGFAGLTGQAELFIPITTRAADDIGQAQSHEFSLVARRKPGVEVAQATSETTVLGARVNEAFPDKLFGGAWGAKATPLDDARIAPVVKRSLYILFGAVGLVLLIACVNVANLLLGRASGRRREIAVRLAIGAGRARLVRLLLTESLLLSVIGGLVGVLVAYWGAHALSGVNPATTLRASRGDFNAVRFSSIHLDATALIFALSVAVVVGILFGLAPALQASGASLSDALKDGGGGVGRRRHFAGRRLLVVAEVAMALVLLAGSGLMIRSLAKRLAVDTGFDGRNVLSLRLTVPQGGLAIDSLPGFYTQLLARLRAVPGVSAASFSNCPPLNGGCNGTLIEFLDRGRTDPAHSPSIGVHWTSPGWFETLHVPLKRGRLFTEGDRVGMQKVVVINEAAAKQFWPNEDPIGKRVGIGQGGFGGNTGGGVVIGIVGGVRQAVDSAPKPDVYLPYLQSPRSGMLIFVRAARDAAALAPSVRRAIREIAPRYPIYDVQLLTDRVAAATAQARFSAALLGLFAGVALSLAVIGIYGVMSLAVAQRTREIGIRMALGADRRAVLRMVVGEGLGLTASGAAIGLVGAIAATRVLRSLLFDVSPSDPGTYLSIILLLAGAAALATWIPARRATRVHPTEALRAG